MRHNATRGKRACRAAAHATKRFIDYAMRLMLIFTPDFDFRHAAISIISRPSPLYAMFGCLMHAPFSKTAQAIFQKRYAAKRQRRRVNAQNER